MCSHGFLRFVLREIEFELCSDFTEYERYIFGSQYSTRDNHCPEYFISVLFKNVVYNTVHYRKLKKRPRNNRIFRFKNGSKGFREKCAERTGSNEEEINDPPRRRLWGNLFSGRSRSTFASTLPLGTQSKLIFPLTKINKHRFRGFS